jgi:hypothetical protein
MANIARLALFAQQTGGAAAPAPLCINCDQRASTSERAGGILISDMVQICEKKLCNTFFRWNVYSTPFAGSFYPYMELVTILYMACHTENVAFLVRAVSCILCILCSVL